MREFQIINADVLDGLLTLADGSVHCVVTSPPYWGLRDYGTATWNGGDSSCAHRVGGQVADSKAPGAIVAGIRPGVDASRCLTCGAVRADNQIGLERTPEEYTARLVEVFREVRRVLRDDGTLWLNLGDSYATGGGAVGRCPGGGEQGERFLRQGHINTQPNRMKLEGLKSKDLIGIPWRVAFALQADGWYLRSDIIWSKPNPMPESVRDRPTKAHEYVFLLSKSERYYYDADAVAERSIHSSNSNTTRDIPTREDGRGIPDNHLGRAFPWQGATRNRRTVWMINTQPYADAHFAVMPVDLVDPCVRAGCPEGGTVLDPFSGAGTVPLVAVRLGRVGIGIELNPAYCDMARRRIMNDAPMFTEEIA